MTAIAADSHEVKDAAAEVRVMSTQEENVLGECAGGRKGAKKGHRQSLSSVTLSKGIFSAVGICVIRRADSEVTAGHWCGIQ